MTTEIFNLLLQAGAPSLIAGVFIWYIDRQDKRTNTLISNHLQHSTDALTKLTRAIQKLTTVVDSKLKSDKIK